MVNIIIQRHKYVLRLVSVRKIQSILAFQVADETCGEVDHFSEVLYSAVWTRHRELYTATAAGSDNFDLYQNAVFNY